MFEDLGFGPARPSGPETSALKLNTKTKREAIRWILKILHDPKYLIPWEIVVLQYIKVMQEF